MSEPIITIGGKVQEEPGVKRLSLLIWGPSGIGKTTLAATMPGRKALINFDPDGPTSIPHVPNISVFDFTNMSDNETAKFKNSDPLDLKRTFEHFDSYIFDSLTMIQEKTLGRGVDIVKGATTERPSPGAYQARNALLLALVRSCLAVTYEAGKHICFITHEGSPLLNEEGSVTNITMALGGQLPNSVALRINEVWPMFEDGRNNKYIITRKSRMRSPAKSRMFVTEQGKTEFAWKFKPEDWDHNEGMRIEDWYRTWEANKFEKIAMPK